MSRLGDKYKNEIIEQLKKDFGYTNPMEVPKLTKINVNMGLGEAIKNPKIIDSALDELSLITGQKPVITRARKSIATFKLREGMPIGVTVTLRRDRMFEFLDRLMNFALPRVRDFRGVSPKGFDGRGNFTMGMKEQIVFPEIDYDKVEKIHGMDITVVTSAGRDDLAMALLRELGWPFRGETPVPMA